MTADFEIRGPLVGDRLDRVRQFMLAATLPLELRLPDPPEIRLRSSVLDVGRLRLYRTHGSGATGVRTARLARDHSTPRLVVSMLREGGAKLSQHGRQARLTAGDVVLYTSTAPLESTWGTGAGVAKHTLMVPLDLLGLPARLVNAVVAVPIRGDHPFAPVLTSYLSGLAQSASLLAPADRATLETPTVDLVRALVANVNGRDDLGRESLARTLDVRIREYLRLHFADRDLSAAMIARAHGISERYLYVILARAGISLGDWVRRQRLAAAAEALRETSGTQVSITSIAHRFGFADHAHFSRTFRRYYGTSPTHWRRGTTP